MKYRLLATGAIALISSVALANDAGQDKSYGKTSDMDKQHGEHSGMTGKHHGMSADHDKLFSKLDHDGDGSISGDEFDRYTDKERGFSRLDGDSDGRIAETEYVETGWDTEFDTLDADNDSYLDSDEYYDGVFTVLDEDENRHLDGDEWDDAGDAGLFDV